MLTGIGSYVMVDKVKAQNETATSQKFTNLQIGIDLLARSNVGYIDF